MYFVFTPRLTSYKNGSVDAKFLTAHSSDILAPNVYIKWDKAKPLEPIEEPRPFFRFEVRKKIVHPDNYWSGSTREPYSGRLLSLLKKNGVRFETFDTEIYERKSDIRVLEDYRVFRLMETFSLLDPDKTVIGDSYSVLNMAFRDVLEVRPPAMFRDENHRYLTFVSSDLREQMESQGITGCLFRTLDEYIQDS